MANMWNGFSEGDKVVMLIQTMGATADDEEVVYSAETAAVISSIENFGGNQGWGVHVVIGEGDKAIVNVFDDYDVGVLGRVPFRKA